MALGALLLQRRIVDPETDLSNEAKVLNTHYDVAFRSTLEDLDLDSTSTEATLELIETDPNDYWHFSYKYPSDCSFLRRIKSCVIKDNKSTHIPKRIAVKNNQKVIFTNEENAVIEYISYNVPLTTLSPTVGLCIAYRLAEMSAPLITGKGAQKLLEDIRSRYIVYKAEAQEKDRRENFNFENEEVESEFVEARLE